MWRWDTGAVLVVLVKPALPSFKPVLHRGFRSMPAVRRILCGECPRIIEFWGIRVASNIEIEYASLHNGGGLYGLIIYCAPTDHPNHWAGLKLSGKFYGTGQICG